MGEWKRIDALSLDFVLQAQEPLKGFKPTGNMISMCGVKTLPSAFQLMG